MYEIRVHYSDRPGSYLVVYSKACRSYTVSPEKCGEFNIPTLLTVDKLPGLVEMIAKLDGFWTLEILKSS